MPDGAFWPIPGITSCNSSSSHRSSFGGCKSFFGSCKSFFGVGERVSRARLSKFCDICSILGSSGSAPRDCHWLSFIWERFAGFDSHQPRYVNIYTVFSLYFLAAVNPGHVREGCNTNDCMRVLYQAPFCHL